MKRLFTLIVMASLSGCGVETMETAAIAAKSKQQEIEQAKQLQENISEKLDAATKLEQQRLDEATRNQQ